MIIYANWWQGLEVPKAFSYDHTTLEFKGVIDLDPSPLEPGIWLEPADCTLIAPPDIREQGKAMVWNPNQNAWELIADMRGKLLFHKNQLKPPFICEILGRYPEWTDKQPPDKPVFWIEDRSKWVVDIQKYKAWVKDKIRVAESDARVKYTGIMDSIYASTLYAKVERARRALSGLSQSDIEIIQLEADQRGLGESWQQLANLQIQKSVRHDRINALIDGITASAYNTLAGANTEEGIDAVMTRYVADVESALSGE